MIIKFSDYLTIDDGIDVNKLLSPSILDSINNKVTICLNKLKIQAISISELCRSIGSDGKYHAIYLWVDYDSGEYYIGKVNRAKWTEIKRYVGSGVKFKNKYEKNSKRFVRYYLFACDSEKETEKLEAKLVTETLLNDPFCLNLVCGGGGISQAPFGKYRKAKQSQYMKEHPERYKAMMDAVKHFDESVIKKRNESIKKTMSTEENKKRMSERIRKWKAENPEQYAIARENNKIANDNVTTKANRVKNIKKWRNEHPEEALEWNENIKKSLSKPETKAKQKAAINAWIATHPAEMKERNRKSLETRMNNNKSIAMLDAKTRSIIKVFNTAKDASNWLKENGYTNSKNPSSSICAVCQKKAIPGHGTKKTAYGFIWEYFSADNKS